MRRRLPLALALLLCAGACRSEQRPVIAVIGNERAAAAARLALADVNASGGIRGRPLGLTIVIENTSSGRTAIRNAQQIADQAAVIAVVGHAGSNASVAAAQVYNSAGLPQLAPSTSAPVYTQAGPYSFRMIPSDLHQAEFLVRQLGPGAQRIALVYSNGDYGRGLHKALMTAMRGRGLAPTLETTYVEPLDRAQLEILSGDVAQAAPDVVFWLGQPRELATTLPLLRQRLQSVTVYASDAMDASETYGEMRAQLRSVRFARFIDPETPGLDKLRSRFRAATGVELTYDAVFTYDAVLLLAEALRAGARSRADVRRYLDELGRTRPPFVGLGGPIAFDGRRDALRPYLLGEVRDTDVHAIPAR